MLLPHDVHYKPLSTPKKHHTTIYYICMAKISDDPRRENITGGLERSRPAGICRNKNLVCRTTDITSNVGI